MRFGFNSGYDGHLESRGKLAGVRPDTFRQGIIDTDPAFWVVDDLVSKLAMRPLVVIYTVDHTPSASLYADIARELVRRQPNVIIQVFNEPNNPTFGGVNPGIVNSVIKAVEEAVPEGTGVYGPAMSPHDIDGVEWKPYMRECYQGTTVKPAVHLYPRREIAVAVKEAFDLAKECGEGAVQVTECGCPRDSWPNQAAATQKLYNEIKARNAGTCIFHTAMEIPPLSEWDQASRLWFLRKDGTRTGLYDAIAQLR